MYQNVEKFIVLLVSVVGFSCLMSFTPLIILEMFDKEHASVGVGLVLGFSGFATISSYGLSSKRNLL